MCLRLVPIKSPFLPKPATLSPVNAFADWLFVVVWIVALFATFIPVAPAGFIIVGTALLHELLVGFGEISLPVWVALAVLTVLSSLVDNIAGALGAKHFGGSRQGVWGAFIGGIMGIFVLPPLGLFLMPLVGAYVGELVAGRSAEAALRGAWGAVLGLLGGLAGKFLIHLLMGVLVIQAIF
nr:DUF456 domain-containing protein [Meiothermus sp. CFH 77666]